MKVAGLLLAAGAGTRFGGPKALVELSGELLVERGVRLLTEGGCDPLVAVLGAAADRVQAVTSLPYVVVAAGWAEGMGTSLRAGLDDLVRRPDVQACVIALADQPLVGAGAVVLLRQAWEAGAVAAVATYDGRPRNPVLLDRSVWSEVAVGATGDTGAREWLRAHPEQVVPVPCDGTGSPYDIDTPEDLRSVHRA